MARHHADIRRRHMIRGNNRVIVQDGIIRFLHPLPMKSEQPHPPHCAVDGDIHARPVLRFQESSFPRGQA